MVFEIPQDYAQENTLVRELWECMTQGWPFKVPLDAEVKCGTSWGTLKKTPRKMFDPIGAAKSKKG